MKHGIIRMGELAFTMWRHWWGVLCVIVHAMFHVMVSGFHVMLGSQWKSTNAIRNVTCYRIQFLS